MNYALRFVLLATAQAALLLTSAHAQGTFRNLDFELANVPDLPYGQAGADVSVAEGMPYWTANIGTNTTSTMLHNNFNLGNPAIAILGPSWSGVAVFQGNYMLLLQASFPSGLNVPSIAQTGTIAASAKSIFFDYGPVNRAATLSFAGQNLPLSVVGGSNTNFDILGADISSFAGQTGNCVFPATAIWTTSSFPISRSRNLRSVCFQPWGQLFCGVG
jgi:hypothetical protein